MPRLMKEALQFVRAEQEGRAHSEEGREVAQQRAANQIGVGLAIRVRPRSHFVERTARTRFRRRSCAPIREE